MSRDVRSQGLLGSTVRGLAAVDLHACTVLHRLAMRFEADAADTLAEACDRHGWDVDEVVSQLTAAAAGLDPSGERRWELDQACRSVVSAHHGPLRVSLGELRAASTRLAGAHGDRFPRLRDWCQRLDALGDTLIDHFEKEENAVFPLFASLVAARRAALAGAASGVEVSHAIGAMAADHDAIDADLTWLLQQARDLVPPLSADAEWHRCVQHLNRFADQLRAHAGFEDDVLFATALDLERTPV